MELILSTCCKNLVILYKPNEMSEPMINISPMNYCLKPFCMTFSTLNYHVLRLILLIFGTLSVGGRGGQGSYF